MNIRPSAAIRQNYNEIAEFCKTTGEPVYLTKNGEGDLVVMDIEAFERREKMMVLREKLMMIENERLRGAKYYSVDELDLDLQNVIAAAKERYTVAISGEARQMLRDHIYFLARVNPQAAEELRKTIISEIRSLETMPERFPYLEPENRKSAYRKMFVPNWYLVLYTVVDTTVYVEYIIDCRQDYDWLR